MGSAIKVEISCGFPAVSRFVAVKFPFSMSVLYNSLEKIRLPPFSLIRDFGKQNTHENVSKISVSLTCY